MDCKVESMNGKVTNVMMYEKDGKFFKRDVEVEVDETEYLRWKVEELERKVKELESKNWWGYYCPGPYLCPYGKPYTDVGTGAPYTPWTVTYTCKIV